VRRGGGFLLGSVSLRSGGETLDGARNCDEETERRSQESRGRKGLEDRNCLSKVAEAGKAA